MKALSCSIRLKKRTGLFLFFICSLILSHAGETTPAFADSLLFRLNLQEYSSPSRSGVIDFIQPSTLPPSTSGGVSNYFTTVWVEASYEKICEGASIALPGGTAEGWLLGPVTGEIVNNFYNRYFDRDASTVFLIFVGPMLYPDIGGSGTRIHCSGAVTSVAHGQILLFLLDSPIGAHVADLYYYSELSISGEWYKVTL